MTPRHDDGSISGIESFYTREREDDRDWDEMIKARKEQEDMEKIDMKKNADKADGGAVSNGETE